MSGRRRFVFDIDAILANAVLVLGVILGALLIAKFAGWLS